MKHFRRLLQEKNLFWTLMRLMARLQRLLNTDKTIMGHRILELIFVKWLSNCPEYTKIYFEVRGKLHS